MSLLLLLTLSADAADIFAIMLDDARLLFFAMHCRALFSLRAVQRLPLLLRVLLRRRRLLARLPSR